MSDGDRIVNVPAETFTEFMIRCMESQDNIEQAIVIMRRSDGTFGYRTFQQEVMDTLGMLRFTAMSIENDTINLWKSEE